MQGDFSEIGDGTITMPFYEVLAEDLVKQRNRLGGDWAIAQSPPSLFRCFTKSSAKTS